MFDDGDRTLDVVGILLAVGILAALGVVALSIANAPSIGSDPPSAEWRLDRVNETHAEIVHDGGEPVAAEELVVMIVRYERSTGWSGTLAEGDGTVVQARAGQTVELYFEGERGDRQRIAQWPDAGAPGDGGTATAGN